MDKLQYSLDIAPIYIVGEMGLLLASATVHSFWWTMGEECWAAEAVGWLLSAFWRSSFDVANSKGNNSYFWFKKKSYGLVLNPIHLISFYVSCHFYFRFLQIV